MEVMSVSRVEAQAIIGEGVFDLADEWNLIARAHGSYFKSEVWARNWWLHLAKRPPIQSVVVRNQGQVVAIATLAEQSIPLHSRLPLHPSAWISIGSLWGGADHLGPLIVNGDQGAKEHIISWLTQIRGESVLLPAVDPSEDPGGLLASRMTEVDWEECPQAVIPPGSSSEDIKATWSRNRRKKLGQLQRRFERAGGSSHWYSDVSELTEWLPIVRMLHRKRMEQLGRVSSFGWEERHAAFHNALCLEASREMGPWIQVCEFRGNPIGVLYGFRIGDTYHVYQSGWDPNQGEMSPGLLQYSLAFDRVIDFGGTLFDMCRGVDDYKLRFATRIKRETILASPRGLGGSLLRLRWWAKRTFDSS